MFRYKMTLEYDGSFFCGWQSQNSDTMVEDLLSYYNEKNKDHRAKYQENFDIKPSIQGIITSVIRRITGEETKVEGAGRTDAGVHALNQVAHFDLPKLIEPRKLQGAINAYVKNFSISVLTIEPVDENFHARFCAVSREYEYHIVNQVHPLAIEKSRAWHVKEELDTDAMQNAAKHLIGLHDFSAFRAANCQSKNPKKTIDSIDIIVSELNKDSKKIIIRLKARSFLHNQVRIITGTLTDIGKGKKQVCYIKELLQNKDRTKAGRTAPPYGLYLSKVSYN